MGGCVNTVMAKKKTRKIDSVQARQMARECFGIHVSLATIRTWMRELKVVQVKKGGGRPGARGGKLFVDMQEWKNLLKERRGW